MGDNLLLKYAFGNKKWSQVLTTTLLIIFHTTGRGAGAELGQVKHNLRPKKVVMGNFDCHMSNKQGWPSPQLN